MSEMEKAPYEKMNEKDKARMEKQLAELNKKGFFTMPDGSKSTDPQNVPKKRKSMKVLEKTKDADKSKRMSGAKAKSVLN